MLAQAILIARHALELEGVDRGQPLVELDEAFRIAEIRDPLLRREREMKIAARTDAVVFHELDFVHDLAATGTFLPETLRDLALFFALGFKRGFFKNGHVLDRGRWSPRYPKG